MTNLEIYDTLKNKVNTFSLQISTTFERKKDVTVGGKYKGHVPYVDKSLPAQLIEIILSDGVSDFSVFSLREPFIDSVDKLQITIGDIVVCNGFMTDKIDDNKTIIIYSVEKI